MRCYYKQSVRKNSNFVSLHLLLDTGSEGYLVVGLNVLSRYLSFMRKRMRPILKDYPLELCDTNASIYEFGCGQLACVGTYLIPFFFDSQWTSVRIDVVHGYIPFIAGYLFMKEKRVVPMPVLSQVYIVEQDAKECSQLMLRELPCAAAGDGPARDATSLWLPLTDQANTQSIKLQISKSTPHAPAKQSIPQLFPQLFNTAVSPDANSRTSFCSLENAFEEFEKCELAEKQIPVFTEQNVESDGAIAALLSVECVQQTEDKHTPNWTTPKPRKFAKEVSSSTQNKQVETQNAFSILEETADGAHGTTEDHSPVSFGGSPDVFYNKDTFVHGEIRKWDNKISKRSVSCSAADRSSTNVVLKRENKKLAIEKVFRSNLSSMPSLQTFSECL